MTSGFQVRRPNHSATLPPKQKEKTKTKETERSCLIISFVCVLGFTIKLNFKAGSEFFKTLLKVVAHPAYQTSVKRIYFTVPFLKYKRLKLKLRVFLVGHSVAMATYSVTKITPTCSPMIGQFFDIIIVASIDKEW